MPRAIARAPAGNLSLFRFVVLSDTRLRRIPLPVPTARDFERHRPVQPTWACNPPAAMFSGAASPDPDPIPIFHRGFVVGIPFRRRVMGEYE
jgi:hypothetical protein